MDFMTIINAVFAVIALVAGGVSTLLLGSLKALRDDNNDLRARGDDNDKKIATLTAEVKLLKNDRDALARQLRGDDKLDAFARQLEDHHREAMEHWAKGEALLIGIADELTSGGSNR